MATPTIHTLTDAFRDPGYFIQPRAKSVSSVQVPTVNESDLEIISVAPAVAVAMKEVDVLLARVGLRGLRLREKAEVAPFAVHSADSSSNSPKNPDDAAQNSCLSMLTSEYFLTARTTYFGTETCARPHRSTWKWRTVRLACSTQLPPKQAHLGLWVS